MIAPAIPLPVTIPASSASRHQNQLGCQAACTPKHQAPAWHAGFLRLLPAIRKHAHICFRRLPHHAREEAVAETIANALAAYVRLVQLDKEDIAYATPLARFAVARTRCGRWVGGRHNFRDVSSNACQHRNGVVMHRVGHQTFDDGHGGWQEIVVEDKRTRPADVAATRVDFRCWLATLSRRDREIAEALAIGEKTKAVARMFRVSEARISQLRRRFFEAWQQFHGEPADGPVLATA